MKGLAARTWFARIMLAYGVLIFGFLTSAYLLQPADYLANFNLDGSPTPEAISFIRVTAGALFLSLLLCSLWGLSSRARYRPGLALIVLLNGCIVAGRLLGITLDGATPSQFVELRDEGVSWLLFVAALWLLPRELR